ncbi:metabolite traffic protein EboE [Kribbella sp. NPDC049227]|uniref:metabolite traffic protein EboE n=1 Tax=Kribbella sp. NPDC049227 TaxID=3364113 RepID=UPI00371F1F23
MKLSDRLGHLTYSTLVHPGDTWAEMRDSVTRHVPAVKARVSPDAPMGLSLRLSGASVATLLAEPAERADFLGFLRSQDLYVYTVNAFPHGPFKGRSVMEQVYEPDWATEDRTRYTMGVADVLVDITEPDVEPSIQTAPLAFRPNVDGPAFIDRFTTNLLRVVAHLVDVERRTGRLVKLSLEPEPFCFLETTEETVRYFEERIYSRAGTEELAKLASVPVSAAVGLVRRHLGVVFDIGHQSVEFEDIPAALESLVAAGIPIFKLQEAAALWVPEVTAETVQDLKQFTDTIYLSQTTERRDGQLTRFLNLGDAIEAWYDAPGGRREWRTHFHVPVFLDEIGGFRTTRSSIEAALDLHRRTPLSDHLEIETYTWDVLPEHLKTGDIDEYVSREIDWVRDTLGAN